MMRRGTRPGVATNTSPGAERARVLEEGKPHTLPPRTLTGAAWQKGRVWSERQVVREAGFLSVPQEPFPSLIFMTSC